MIRFIFQRQFVISYIIIPVILIEFLTLQCQTQRYSFLINSVLFILNVFQYFLHFLFFYYLVTFMPFYLILAKLFATTLNHNLILMHFLQFFIHFHKLVFYWRSFAFWAAANSGHQIWVQALFAIYLLTKSANSGVHCQRGANNANMEFGNCFLEVFVQQNLR